MSDLGLDASQETRITVMQLKIERLEEKQDELRERLKVVEKWVIGAAAVLAAAPITHFSTTFNLSRNSSCFSSSLSIFNCITVILVSCEASSPKSDMILNFNCTI
jgi:hypothetical protein